MVALPELEACTVEDIGAVLGDVVDDATHVAAVFGVVVGDNLEFGNGVLVAKEERRAADGVVVVILAIDLIVVGAPALAVDGKLSPVVVFKTSRAYGGDARREHHK